MALRPPHADPDPLERHYVARAVVLVALLMSGVASVISLGDGFRQGLPGVALGSPFLLHVERALVVGAGVAAVLIFAIRGWVGYFPSISTAGAEYLRRPVVDAAFDGEIELHERLGQLRSIQESMARSTRLRLDEVERDLAFLKSQRAHRRMMDDML